MPVKALEVRNLCKTFVNTVALRNVSLEVEAGTVTGIIGPNGAGKTTLLRIINNILLPDSGEVEIFSEPLSFESSRTIGYMPEERGLYDNMRVEDQIIYFGRLKGGDPSELRRNMAEYMEIFNLTGQERRKIKELSKGNQQKVQIIATIVHNPRLLILDEPFSGFDPLNGQLLTQLVDKLKHKGITILLSSHNMASIEEMCSHINLINHGDIVLSGELSEIKNDFKDGRYIIATSSPIAESLVYDGKIVTSLEPCELPRGVRGTGYLVSKNPDITNNELIQALSWQTEILHFQESLPSLSDIFIRTTQAKQ